MISQFLPQESFWRRIFVDSGRRRSKQPQSFVQRRRRRHHRRQRRHRRQQKQWVIVCCRTFWKITKEVVPKQSGNTKTLRFKFCRNFWRNFFDVNFCRKYWRFHSVSFPQNSQTHVFAYFAFLVTHFWHFYSLMQQIINWMFWGHKEGIAQRLG